MDRYKLPEGAFEATSESANFSDDTWTFRMQGDYAVGAGCYVLMPWIVWRRFCDEKREITSKGMP